MHHNLIQFDCINNNLKLIKKRWEDLSRNQRPIHTASVSRRLKTRQEAETIVKDLFKNKSIAKIISNPQIRLAFMLHRTTVQTPNLTNPKFCLMKPSVIVRNTYKLSDYLVKHRLFQKNESHSNSWIRRQSSLKDIRIKKIRMIG